MELRAWLTTTREQAPNSQKHAGNYVKQLREACERVSAQLLKHSNVEQTT